MSQALSAAISVLEQSVKKLERECVTLEKATAQRGQGLQGQHDLFSLAQAEPSVPKETPKVQKDVVEALDRTISNVEKLLKEERAHV